MATKVIDRKVIFVTRPNALKPVEARTAPTYMHGKRLCEICHPEDRFRSLSASQRQTYQRRHQRGDLVEVQDTVHTQWIMPFPLVPVMYLCPDHLRERQNQVRTVVSDAAGATS